MTRTQKTLFLKIERWGFLFCNLRNIEKSRQELNKAIRRLHLEKGEKMARKKDRDIEKGYSVKQMAAKLRRLADCLENGKQFRIQIAGERIQIPAKALFNIEHEREGNNEEVEFQFKWEH